VPCSVYTAAQSMLHIVSSRQRRYTRSVCDSRRAAENENVISPLGLVSLLPVNTYAHY